LQEPLWQNSLCRPKIFFKVKQKIPGGLSLSACGSVSQNLPGRFDHPKDEKMWHSRPWLFH
jgi:hypothetical protein